ncbi:MAG: FtsW/RodA/SpoVE family cell cycle protein [Ignavibacteriaceae bacterium]|nr:FtsW/RodA/SpoVE family cell cycle protein [Ignavibacteriaceae bacterium]
MKKYPIIIFFATIILIIIGSSVVMSASSTFSIVKHNNQFALFSSHISKALIGIIVLVIFSIIDYRYWMKFTKPALFAALFLVLITPFVGDQIKGAQRSISIMGFSFMPVEIAKYALFLHLANLMQKYADEPEDMKKNLLIPLGWIMGTAVLVVMLPNVSNASLIILIGLTILFLAGIPMRYFAGIAAAGVIVFLLAIVIKPHAQVRVMTYMESFMGDKFPNTQVQQSVYAMGSGGITGVGLGSSNQRNLFLPEAYGDFIYAILGEETGLVGALAVLLLYIAIFVFGLLISKNAEDKFGKLAGMAITLSIIVYGFVNVSVATGMAPTTGLPLPFISHGGTSLVILCAMTGILMSIGFRNASREAQKNKTAWKAEAV